MVVTPTVRSQKQEQGEKNEEASRKGAGRSRLSASCEYAIQTYRSNHLGRQLGNRRKVASSRSESGVRGRGERGGEQCSDR